LAAEVDTPVIVDAGAAGAGAVTEAGAAGDGFCVTWPNGFGGAGSDETFSGSTGETFGGSTGETFGLTEGVFGGSTGEIFGLTEEVLGGSLLGAGGGIGAGTVSAWGCGGVGAPDTGVGAGKEGCSAGFTTGTGDGEGTVPVGSAAAVRVTFTAADCRAPVAAVSTGVVTDVPSEGAA
jgi:hypothetical protein